MYTLNISQTITEESTGMIINKDGRFPCMCQGRMGQLRNCHWKVSECQQIAFSRYYRLPCPKPGPTRKVIQEHVLLGKITATKGVPKGDSTQQHFASFLETGGNAENYCSSEACKQGLSFQVFSLAAWTTLLLVCLEDLGSKCGACCEAARDRQFPLPTSCSLPCHLEPTLHEYK